MAYLNLILQLPMALLLLAQLLVMVTAWFTNAVTIWQRLSMTFAALVLAGGHLVIMYGFGYLADAHVPIAGLDLVCFGGGSPASACNHRGSQQT